MHYHVFKHYATNSITLLALLRDGRYAAVSMLVCYRATLRYATEAPNVIMLFGENVGRIPKIYSKILLKRYLNLYLIVNSSLYRYTDLFDLDNKSCSR